MPRYNNLKAKSKAILEAYVLEMNINESSFFMRLSTIDYITEEEIKEFTFSDFRYRAYQTGII